jgi:hypothetical protein
MPVPSQQIIDELTSWPGVVAGPGRRGELAFKLGRRELGHLHVALLRLNYERARERAEAQR